MRKLQAHAAELVLSLGAQDVRSCSPEVGDRCANGGIVLLGVGVYVSGICDLAFGGRVDAVDLGGSERLEGGQVEGFSKNIDTGVLEELVSGLVDNRCGWIALEIAGAWEFAWEVVACVKELEEASDGIEVFVDEVNSTLLLII